jgi:ABC-type transport system substrate-binding protein
MPNRFVLPDLFQEDSSMKNQDLYARLELLPTDLNPPTSADSSRVKPFWVNAQSHLTQVGRALLNYFSGSIDPRIAKKWNANGRELFRVYDPVERTHQLFDSEQELRVWLEQRYYQTPGKPNSSIGR